MCSYESVGSTLVKKVGATFVKKTETLKATFRIGGEIAHVSSSAFIGFLFCLSNSRFNSLANG